jgi:hypothetical protein
MAGEATAEPRLEPPVLEVDLVVDDENGVRLELEESGGGPDRPAGFVHVRLGLEQADAMAVEAHLGELAGELPSPGAAVATCELVDDHAPDVVPVVRVLAPRIAEPDDE